MFTQIYLSDNVNQNQIAVWVWCMYYTVVYYKIPFSELYCHIIFWYWNFKWFALSNTSICSKSSCGNFTLKFSPSKITCLLINSIWRFFTCNSSLSKRAVFSKIKEFFRTDDTRVIKFTFFFELIFFQKEKKIRCSQ